MKNLALSLALGAGVVFGVPAAMAGPTLITVNLSGSNLVGDPLVYDLPDAAFTSNGLPIGDLIVNGSNTVFPSSVAVRRSQGLGVRSCTGLSCFVESLELDGLIGADTATFTISNQAPGFEFILVSATFASVDDIGFNLLDDVRLSFGGNDHDVDIAGVANAQGTNPCNLIAGDRECSVNFVDHLGGGDPFLLAGGGFGFTALGALDAWYIKEIVWEIGRQRAVPEPASLAVFGLGLLGLGVARRRRAA